MNFTEFNLNEKLLKGIEEAGYTECTDVQEQVLKSSQDGSDLYVQSQTGTGKTAAYLVAIIQEMLNNQENKKALILVPTRELAVQVEQEVKVLARYTDFKSFSFFGGVGYEKQINALKRGIDIIIATPGRLIDLQEGKNIDLSNVGFVVVDEADRMFDMGFYPELRKILKYVPAPENRQTMLFSATLNSYVKNLSWEYTRDPKEIEIAAENVTVSEISQELFHVSSDEKMKLLVGILTRENPENVIIFCNTKRSCEVIAKRLQLNDFKADFIIGDLPQSLRLKKLNDFKNAKTSILVATDVAARGIDVNNLQMVINYDLPNEPENYVHRIGRTARAGKSGKAYTFCSEQDVYSLPAIERYIEISLPSHVAYPEELAEDKSNGIYIKTEFLKDEERSYKKSEFHKDGTRNRKNYEKSDYKKGSKASNYKKDYKKSDKKHNKFEKTNDKEFEKLENLSFDERIKFYKEKYSSSYKFDDKKSKNGKKNSYKKDKNKNYKQNYNKKSQKDYAKPQENVKKEKKGIFAKLKSLFSKK